MKQHVKHYSIAVVAVLVILALGAGAFAYSGLYNIGADDHTKPVYSVMQMVRDRSIHARSKDIVVPNLDDPQLILKGAGQYAAMCTGCHLEPGMQDSEIRPGLYPQPPNLSQVRVDPKDAFWVIKHGIKMSAMPAWGGSHDDATMWSMVAFLQKLPDMTPQQYKDMVAKAPADHDMDMDGGGHSHGATAEDDHEHAPVAPTSGNLADATMATEAPLSLAGLKPQAVPEAEAVARALQAALRSGDRAAVLALLAPEVTVSEGGHTESHDEYANGHLGEDIAFLKDATVTPISLGSMPMGGTAMVGSESTIKTIIKGKPIALRSREMLTLKQVGNAWKIVTIQWQSTPLTENTP